MGSQHGSLLLPVGFVLLAILELLRQGFEDEDVRGAVAVSVVLVLIRDGRVVGQSPKKEQKL